MTCREGLRLHRRARAMIVHQTWNDYHHLCEVLEGSKRCCWEALEYLGSVGLWLMKCWRLTCFAFKLEDPSQYICRASTKRKNKNKKKNGAEKRLFDMEG